VCVCVFVCVLPYTCLDNFTRGREKGREEETRIFFTLCTLEYEKKRGGREGETRIFFTLEYDCPEYVGMHRGHCSSIDGVLAYINVPPSNLGFQIKKDVRTPDRSTPPRQSV
jgi:hypothetical protein